MQIFDLICTPLTRRQIWEAHRIALGASDAAEALSNIDRSISLGSHGQDELRFSNYYDVIANIVMAQYYCSGMSKTDACALANVNADTFAIIMEQCSHSDTGRLFSGNFKGYKHYFCPQIQRAVISTFDAIVYKSVEPVLIADRHEAA